MTKIVKKKMSLMRRCVSLVLIGASLVSQINGFVLPRGLQRQRLHGVMALKYTVSSSSDGKAEVEDMKRDIEQMRLEAIRRLEALNEKMHQADVELQAKEKLEQERKEEEQKRNNAQLNKTEADPAAKAKEEAQVAQAKPEQDPKLMKMPSALAAAKPTRH